MKRGGLLASVPYRNLSHVVAVLNDRATRGDLTIVQRAVRARCVAEMSRRERIAAIAQAVYSGEYVSE